MREGVNWWERVKNWPQRDVDSGGGLCHTMVLQPFYPTLFYTDSYPFPLNVSALLCYDTPLLHPFHISQNMALLLYPASFQSAMKSTWRVWRAVNWCALVWAHLSKWKPFHRQPPVFFTGSPEYFVNCHQKYFVKCSPPLRIVTTWGPRRTLLQLWKCQRGHLRNLLYNEIVVVERPLTVKWLFINYCLFLEWEIIFS